MSSSDTPATAPRALSRRGVLLAAMALGACGFRPVYGPGGTGGALQNRVQVVEPEDRAGFLLVRRIEERLGRGTDPAYDLALDLRTRVEGLGIDPEGTATRFNLIGEARYVLTDSTTGQALASGNVNSFTGYLAAGSTVETLASERDALERLMVILGDQIVARLLSADLPA